MTSLPFRAACALLSTLGTAALVTATTSVSVLAPHAGAARIVAASDATVLPVARRG